MFRMPIEKGESTYNRYVILLVLLLMVSCSRYTITKRQFGLNEVHTINKNDILSIDTVYFEGGGSLKVIEYRERVPWKHR